MVSEKQDRHPVRTRDCGHVLLPIRDTIHCRVNPELSVQRGNCGTRKDGCVRLHFDSGRYAQTRSGIHHLRRKSRQTDRLFNPHAACPDRDDIYLCDLL